MAAFLHLHLSVYNVRWGTKATQTCLFLDQDSPLPRSRGFFTHLASPTSNHILRPLFSCGICDWWPPVVFFFLTFLDVSLPCHICPSLGFCRRLKTGVSHLDSCFLHEHETSGRTSSSGVT